jgi:hypothetical protein
MARRGFHHRERLGHDHQYQVMIRAAIAGGGSAQSAVLARALRHPILDAYVVGERWATEVIEALIQAGVTSDVSNEMRFQGGTARILRADTGDVVELPNNVGFHPVRDDGTVENYTQRGFFIDLPLHSALNILQRERNERDTHSDKVVGYERYFAIWREHPGAATARDACALAGIDPFEILEAGQQAI